ncbi:hypothetical protein ACJX0J_029350 [Zea mays]
MIYLCVHFLSFVILLVSIIPNFDLCTILINTIKNATSTHIKNGRKWAISIVLAFIEDCMWQAQDLRKHLPLISSDMDSSKQCDSCFSWWLLCLFPMETWNQNHQKYLQIIKMQPKDLIRRLVTLHGNVLYFAQRAVLSMC